MMICQHSACSDDKKEEGGEMDCSTCYKQIQMIIIIYISIYLLIEQFWVISFYSQGKKKSFKNESKLIFDHIYLDKGSCNNQDACLVIKENNKMK